MSKHWYPCCSVIAFGGCVITSLKCSDLSFSGGYGANSTIEYLDQFKKTWNIVEGIEGVRHCIVALDQGKLILIGGFRNGNKVAMFDPQLEEWVKMPDINVYSDR